VALGIYLLLPSYRRQRQATVWQSLVAAALFTLGFAAVVGTATWLLYANGLLPDALYWVFRHHDMPHGPTDVIFWERLEVSGVWFILCCFPLLAAAAASLGRRRRWWSWPGQDAERATLILLLVMAMLGVCASGRFYLHYFMLLLPALTLAAAPVVTALLAGEVKPGVEGLWPLNPRSMRRVLIASTAIFFVLHGVAAVKHQKGNEAARFIKEHSLPTDRIFVWGELPRVYQESQRHPSSRYICTYPLTGHPYGGAISYDPVYPDTSARIVPGAWDILEKELAARPPRYIVDVEAKMRLPRYPIEKFPRFARFIAQHYRRVQDAGDAVIYERLPPGAAATTG
jgi:hypothetical protein